MKNKLTKITKKGLLLLLLFLLIACSSNESSINGDGEKTKPDDNPSDMTKTMLVSDLEIGDKVIDLTWEWEFRQGYEYTVYSENEVTDPVSWIVVAKDHYEADSVTLLSEYLIGFYIFDNSLLESGILAGYGHWGNSGQNNGRGLRPWLNSTSPLEDEGFYHAFSEEFKSAVILTTIPNYDGVSKQQYTSDDNVFVPSLTEFGASPDEISDTVVLGKGYPYFMDDDESKFEAEIKNSWSYDYWARNTFDRGYRLVGMMTSHGLYLDWFADANNLGVRPALSIHSNTKITSEPNADGYYEIVY